ncbi:MAG: hypothetical protein AAF492_01255 [Verrucomicrobiota bacterium]
MTAIFLLTPFAFAGAAGSLNGTVKIKKGRGFVAPEDVMIWLKPNKPIQAKGGHQHRIITRKKAFSPQYLVIEQGDTISFPNYDPFKHNVFSSSKENVFDLGSYGKGKEPKHTFKKTGVVQIYCNVHPDMAAFIMVTDGQWTHLTDESGSFSFKDVPPGTYELVLWNVRGNLTETITIESGKDVTREFLIDSTKYRPKPHKNKYGKKYPRSFGNDESY